MSEIEPGKGLRSLIQDFDLAHWFREAFEKENEETLRSTNLSLKLVEDGPNGQIVKNESGQLFKVSGKGLNKRLTLLITDKEKEQIIKELSKTNSE